MAVGRPWGGDRVARRFGWRATGPCGEWWLASCQGGVVNPIRGHEGDLASWLEGPGRNDGCPLPADFPVLVKFLDCQQTLSLQVHPDNEVARRHGLPRGKTEAWYVVEAEPGACVYLGTRPGTGARELIDRVAAGASGDDVRALLHRIDVRAGDSLLVEAGTVHAIGGGVMLFEVQQNADTTYRIHDWGRGRPVHLDRAREAAIDRPPVVPSSRMGTPPAGWTTLIENRAFTLRRGHATHSLEYTPPGPFATLTVLDGRGQLPCGEDLAAGDTLWVRTAVQLAGTDLDVLVVEPPR